MVVGDIIAVVELFKNIVDLVSAYGKFSYMFCNDIGGKGSSVNPQTSFIMLLHKRERLH